MAEGIREQAPAVAPEHIVELHPTWAPAPTARSHHLSGSSTRKASITLLHNGVIVHNKRELHGGTTHQKIVPYRKHAETGFIELYEHGNPVRFRNIWIRPLGEYDQTEAGGEKK